MKASTVNVLSIVAISVGSFLLGGSFGISLASRNCENCHSKQFYEEFMNRMNEDSNSVFTRIGRDIDGDYLDEPIRGRIEDPNLVDDETMTEYWRQADQYNIVEDKKEELIEEEDDSYSNTIKEITVGDETIEVKQTEYGTEEVGEPYIISKDSYEYEYEDFAKEDLVYFEEDGVLVDEKDKIIDNPDRYIGSEALDSFGEGSDDEDVVYVRNLRYSIDYHIVKEHTSYRENVLGLTEEGDQAAYEAALAFANTKEQNANIKKE